VVAERLGAGDDRADLRLRDDVSVDALHDRQSQLRVLQDGAGGAVERDVAVVEAVRLADHGVGHLLGALEGRHARADLEEAQ
jgi:hypothetical protein